MLWRDLRSLGTKPWGKDPTKPHPSRPSRNVTPASEYAQLGWILGGLPVLRSARQPRTSGRHESAPAGTSDPCEGLTTEEVRSFLMDTENPSAPTHAESRIPGNDHPHERPRSGVVHDNARHTNSFTVIGNHLTQHRELSLLAIGLACHIQSLRPGASMTALTVAPNPVTAGLAIGTGVVYAGCLIWDNHEAIGDGIEKAGDWMGDKASDIGDGIAGEAKKLGSALNPFD
ncbi:hypothetical protein SALBM311S_08271 [Streptomyces alboniger]